MFPRIIAPAPRNRATSGASTSGTFPFRSRLPHSHGSPATSTELLIETGTPCSDPSAFLPLGALAAASAAFARARARFRVHAHERIQLRIQPLDPLPGARPPAPPAKSPPPAPAPPSQSATRTRCHPTSLPPAYSQQNHSRKPAQSTAAPRPAIVPASNTKLLLPACAPPTKMHASLPTNGLSSVRRAPISSIGWRRIFWRSKATATWSGSRATSRPTRRTSGAGWARTRRSRTGSGTGRSRDDACRPGWSGSEAA